MSRAYVVAVLAKVIKIGLWFGLIFLFLFAPTIVRLLYTERSLSILVWPMTIDTNQVAAFEKETGIKVYINYYENNDELLHKISLTKGQGYDLIMPADYIVEALIKEGLLKKIDTTKLTFYKDLNPSFLHHYFDRKNEYSVPYFIGIYGLGIDRDFFGADMPEISWALLFKQQKKPYKVAMTDDPIHAVLIAAQYLYKTLSGITQEDRLQAIRKLLIEQKPMVEIYTDVRGGDLLEARSCPVVLVISSDLARLQREYKNIMFAVPKEGSFIAIDSFVMPAASTKSSLVYEFLNFIYRPDVLKYHSAKYGFCPPLQNISMQEFGILCPDKTLMRQLNFFESTIDKQYINNLWIDLMAH